MIHSNFAILLAVALALPACDSGDANETQTQVETNNMESAEAGVEIPLAPVPYSEAETSLTDLADGKVRLAAVIAKQISAAPEKAKKIIKMHGLDRKKFDAIMFEIADDPELTNAYMAARRAR